MESSLAVGSCPEVGAVGWDVVAGGVDLEVFR